MTPPLEEAAGWRPPFARLRLRLVARTLSRPRGPSLRIVRCSFASELNVMRVLVLPQHLPALCRRSTWQPCAAAACALCRRSTCQPCAAAFLHDLLRQSIGGICQKCAVSGHFATVPLGHRSGI